MSFKMPTKQKINGKSWSKFEVWHYSNVSSCTSHQMNLSKSIGIKKTESLLI